MNRDSQTWTEYATALAFLGNSLLAPMNQTERLGIDPDFWQQFPDFGDAEVRAAIDACASYAASNAASTAEDDLVRAISVEYTKLFVGPPRPAAAPWETFYRGEGVSVGFGQATFEMQNLLRSAGLEISNENNQYADHIGIELLYASVLCSKGAEEELDAFVRRYPLVWIGNLTAAVDAAAPAGYISNILHLSRAVLATLSK